MIIDHADGLMPSDDEIGNPILWKEVASFLKVTIILMFVGLAAYNILHYLNSPNQWMRILTSLMMVPVGIVSWVLLTQNRIRTAAISFGIGIFISITVISFCYGGAASTSVFIFPLLILLYGWLFGSRIAWQVAGLTILVTLGFVFADAAGYLPPAVLPLAPARAVTQCFTYLFAAILITYAVRSHQERLDEVRHDLAARTAALLATETDLNRAQAVARMGSWVYDLKSNSMTLSDETCRLFGLPNRTMGDYESYL